MTCPELRITDAEVALTRRWPTCRACAGIARDDEGCPRCDWGLYPEGYGIRLGRGASARIGAAIVARLDHLRRAADIVATDGEYELLRTAVGRWGVRTVGVDDAAWADSEAEARIVYASCPRHPEWPS